jgi:hypothetical protein
MTTAVASRPISYVFEFGGPIEFELPATAGLGAHFIESSPTTLVWCLHCERSFELAWAREAGDEVRCGYIDCDGQAPDFWSWDAYRAFADSAPRWPAFGQRYRLAA